MADSGETERDEGSFGISRRGRGRGRGQGLAEDVGGVGRGRGRGRGEGLSEDVGGVGRGRGRGRGTGTGRGRGRGSSSRGRARSRSKEPRPEKSDQQRVAGRLERKKEQMKAVVCEMETEKLRELVLSLIDREPGLIFDLCEGVGEPGPPPQPHQPQHTPEWCKCGNCREMPTELERKCCGCLPRNCISTRHEIEDLCLNPQVLALGQRYHREMLGRYNQPVENYQKLMRHSGYRNFVLWRHGRLGAGVRRVIPSCCIWKIRDRYPSPTGQYTGFIPNRFI